MSKKIKQVGEPGRFEQTRSEQTHALRNLTVTISGPTANPWTVNSTSHPPKKHGKHTWPGSDFLSLWRDNKDGGHEYVYIQLRKPRKPAKRATSAKRIRKAA